MYDSVIRNGSVIDGTGAKAFVADVAIIDGKIAAVGRHLGPARETFDADGLLVTPGFVDIHTHLDGQSLWDPVLAPLTSHGVTTAVMGNCGVGFAPAAPSNRDFLLDLMSGVEDIPRASLAAGIDWSWESFPQYLDALDAKPHVIDLGALVPYGPLRLDVMGVKRAHQTDIERGDADRLAALTREAVLAGALGVAMSRTILHVSLDGEVVPGTYARESEVLGIAAALQAAGRGVLEFTPTDVMGEVGTGVPPEMQWIPNLSKNTGVSVTFTVVQHFGDPSTYGKVLDQCAAANRNGSHIRPQVTGRPTAAMLSFDGLNPFRSLPSFATLLPLSPQERRLALRSPDLRTRLIAERNPGATGIELMFAQPDWNMIFPMRFPLNYFPNMQDSIGRVAQATNADPRAVAYDMMLEAGGTTFLMYLLNNFGDHTNSAAHRMLTDPNAVWGLGDAGAHSTIVADCSFPTLALTYWVRDRDQDDPRRLSIEYAVRKLTSDNAHLFGLHDRGILAPGRKADVNLINLPKLTLRTPQMLFDLPLGMPRVVQSADGFEATFVSGALVQQRGQLTGAQPGKVARSSAPTPARI